MRIRTFGVRRLVAAILVCGLWALLSGPAFAGRISGGGGGGGGGITEESDPIAGPTATAAQGTAITASNLAASAAATGLTASNLAVTATGAANTASNLAAAASSDALSASNLAAAAFAVGTNAQAAAEGKQPVSGVLSNLAVGDSSGIVSNLSGAAITAGTVNSNALDAATLGLLGGGIAEAPSDTEQYVRKDAGWVKPTKIYGLGGEFDAPLVLTASNPGWTLFQGGGTTPTPEIISDGTGLTFKRQINAEGGIFGGENGTGGLSINPTARQLIGNNGSVTLNWSGDNGYVYPSAPGLITSQIIGSTETPNVVRINDAALQCAGDSTALDWCNRTLRNNSGSITLNWSGDNALGAPTFPNGAVIANVYSPDNDNYASISAAILNCGTITTADWCNRTLRNNSGSITLNWSGDNALGSPTFPNGAVIANVYSPDNGNYASISAAILNCGTITAFDWCNRTLLAADGTTVVANWSDGTLKNGMGTAYLTAESDPVFTASEAASFVAGDKAILDDAVTHTEADPLFDFTNRALKDSDGGNAIIWDFDGAHNIKITRPLLDVSDDLSLNLSARQLAFGQDGSSVPLVAIHYDNMDGVRINSYLEGEVTLLSINAQTRQLIGSNGTTVAATWADGMLKDASGDPLVTTNTAANAAYTPANSSHWDGDPTTIKEALDRLAAAVAGLLSGPIP